MGEIYKQRKREVLHLSEIQSCTICDLHSMVTLHVGSKNDLSVTIQ